MSSPVGRWRRPMVGRDPGEDHRASTPLELLFDLCFVVAVAQAASQLHHGLTEGHGGSAVFGYALVFFGIWWAWVNFTWFASAYDTDDVPYRLLTLVQIAGVLVLAASVPAALDHYDFTTTTFGYVIMRIAMVTQWIRASRGHPAARPASLRYAIGISICQIGWLIRLTLPSPLAEIVFILLVIMEILVPIWAEYRGVPTPWHPGHINERYGLFTLIVLGECISAATIAVQSAVTDHGLSGSLLILAAGALLLIFALWWSYFKHEATSRLRISLNSTLIWAYSHYLIFASLAALGAGLQVVIDALVHESAVSVRVAAFAVAIPVVIYAVVGGVMNIRSGRGQTLGFGWTVVFAVLTLFTALAASVITLPGMVLTTGVLMAALLAGKLTVAHHAALRQFDVATHSSRQ